MSEKICPWWLGYVLASPLRRLMQNPEQILSPFVKPGMTLVDVGSAMGFFTLPLAKLVGKDGRVIAVDVQEKMLNSLVARAKRAGLSDRIKPVQCSFDSLGLDKMAGQADFALAFAVLHEMPDVPQAMKEVHASLKPGGCILIAEPKGHVTLAAFNETIRKVEACGFKLETSPLISKSHSAVMRKV